MNRKELEQEYSKVIGDGIWPEARKELEDDLIARLLHEVPYDIAVKEDLDFEDWGLHAWALSGDGIKGIWYMTLWKDGMLTSTLSFYEYPEEA